VETGDGGAYRGHGGSSKRQERKHQRSPKLQISMLIEDDSFYVI